MTNIAANASKENLSEVANIKDAIFKASLEGMFQLNDFRKLTNEEVIYFRELGFDVTHSNGSLGPYWTFRWG